MSLKEQVDNIREDLLINILFNMRILKDDGTNDVFLVKNIQGFKITCMYEHRNTVDIEKIGSLLYDNSEKDFVKVKYRNHKGIDGDYIRYLSTDTLVMIDEMLTEMVKQKALKFKQK